MSRCDDAVDECSQDSNEACDSTTATCPREFDISVELRGDSDARTLTPLMIPDYDELGSGTTHNLDFVDFELEIEGNRVDSLEFEITAGTGSDRQVIIQQTPEARYREVGVHIIPWDGFSSTDVLDTEILKDPHLKLTVTAELAGVEKTATIEFENEAAEQDWVDVSIDRLLRNITVTLRVDLKDGAENGVGERPPSEVATQENLTDTDPRMQPHTRVRSFAELESLALDAVDRYWSRNASNNKNISTYGGDYTVDVSPVNTTENAMDDIDLEYNTNGDFGRSSNPGRIRGFFSFIANMFVSERSIYNIGWIYYDSDNRWHELTPAQADPDFLYTAAHELGHEILSAYGGESYSYGHKGTSRVVTQTERDLDRGGETYPTTGEIDLMKYYHGERPSDYYSRMVAHEVDVESLIWLARVRFNG